MGKRGGRVLAAFVALEFVAVALAYVGPSFSVAGLRFGHSHAGAPDRVASAGGGDASSPTAPEPVADLPVTPAVGTTGPPPPATTTATSATTATTTATTTEAAAPAGTATRLAGWVAAENARTGTDAWKIVAPAPSGWIEGYARSTSARPGEAVPLYIDTASPSYTVEAYRMGFYGGHQGRLVWTSPPMPGLRQPPPTVDAATGMAEARWAPSLILPVGADWPPGSYLLKLVSSAAGASYVPITVRDDDARADLLFMNAVTTWQAYNQWGACSLYSCGGLKGRARAVKVSFDRPYARQFNDGSADFLDHELPLVSLVEELGIDTAYATSIDVHETPSLPARYKGALSLGHDEYYSRRMRQALVDARDGGVNLAFFGANAVYRHIRIEAATDGRADRVEVNHRDARDPVAVTDPADVTIEWRKQQAPEAALVGIQYLCANVSADLVVRSPASWVWAGAGVKDGQVLRGLIGNEADGMARGISPANLDLLASSPVYCGRTPSQANTSYYAAPSGAGVFAAGSIWWICALEARFCSSPANVGPVRAATANVLRAFAQGRAGVAHPSVGRPA